MTGNNRANCDKSMKLGENTEFDKRNKIEYRPILGKKPLCYFSVNYTAMKLVPFLDWVLVPSTRNTLVC